MPTEASYVKNQKIVLTRLAESIQIKGLHYFPEGKILLFSDALCLYAQIHECITGYESALAQAQNDKENSYRWSFRGKNGDLILLIRKTENSETKSVLLNEWELFFHSFFQFMNTLLLNESRRIGESCKRKY